jgi:hypothetical protein
MSAAIMTAAFENGGEAGQIGIDVGEWVDQRMPDTGLRGKMYNVRKAELLEQVRHPAAVGKVQFHEPKPTRLRKLGTPRFLQNRVIVAVHVVEADNVVAVTQETSRNMKPNKACRACHQNRAISHLSHSVSV